MSTQKYCSWPGLLIDPLKITTADAGDVLLRIEYSAESHAFTTEKLYCARYLSHPRDSKKEIYEFA